MWSACVAFPTHLGPRTWHVYRSRRSTSSRNRFSAAELGRGRFRACELQAMSAHLRPHASDLSTGARGPVPGAPGPRATGSRVHGAQGHRAHGPACSATTELCRARCRRAGARAHAQLRAGDDCHVWSSSRGGAGSRTGISRDGADPSPRRDGRAHARRRSPAVRVVVAAMVPHHCHAAHETHWPRGPSPRHTALETPRSSEPWA